MHGSESDSKKHNVNRLIHESSPYLLQHAYNPVDWYPWGEEALDRARQADKPIFLSIGYSACHWCHVMAHESFEDIEIARLMNDKFINIKVDREERPDIDDIYQRVCQMASGSGGWPLSVFLTPDQRPFYVGTYLPKHSKYGMPGFGTILGQLADAYITKKQEIDSATFEFMRALTQTVGDIQANGFEFKLDRSILDEAAVGLLRMTDLAYGGFGQAPKFPNPSSLLFMLRYFDLSGINRFRDFVIFTAEKMAAGGINDQLGGGFARYSTDQKWLIPHFEKMAYDNALLTHLYVELYQTTNDERYLKIVEKTLEYVMREMTSPAGGFYSSQDADSEGEEGKFYVWSKQEIVDSIMDSTASEIFCDYYGVTHAGNFDGKNILYVKGSIRDLSERYGKTKETIEQIIKDVSLKLSNLRENRIKPGRDEKILTSWNGLMISAFAKGYKISNNKTYLEHAINAINFIESKIKRSEECRLNRMYKDGVSKLNAYLDDYAFYVNALLDTFEIDAQPHYLEKAIQYTDFMLKHFWDHKENNLFFTSDDHEKLIVRTKNFYDLAIPSGNSIAAHNLLRLYHLTQNTDYLEKAEHIMKGGSQAAAENPFGFGQLLIAIYFYVKKCVEIVVFRGKEKNADFVLSNWLNKQFIPNSISVVLADSSQIEMLQKYPFFAGRSFEVLGDHSEYVFVCKDFACSLPVHSVQELERQIRSS